MNRASPTAEQALTTVIDILSDRKKQLLIDTPERRLISLHFSLGAQIRTALGLWRLEAEPLLAAVAAADPSHPNVIDWGDSLSIDAEGRQRFSCGWFGGSSSPASQARVRRTRLVRDRFHLKLPLSPAVTDFQALPFRHALPSIVLSHARPFVKFPTGTAVQAFVIGVIVLWTGASAHAADGRGGAQTAAEAVASLYALVDGSRSRCPHAFPRTAAAHERALSRFTARHPGLISRLRQSPHYEQARRQFAADAGYDPARDTAQNLDPECSVQTSILQMMTDTDAGLDAMRRYEALLSK